MFGPTQPMNKRYAYLFVAIGATLVISLIVSFRNQAEGTRHPDLLLQQDQFDTQHVPLPLSDKIGILAEAQPVIQHANAKAKEASVPLKVTGPGVAIAEKLGNETVKAELGRAAWKLFHTTFARFPDKPTADESTALESYVYLFQRLYPCGECATHFGQILEKFPPQVSSRSSAAAWGCHVHNEVNKSLKKELFDCSNIGDFYDCGCKDTEDEDEDEDGDSEDNDNSATQDKDRGEAHNLLVAGDHKVEFDQKRNKWSPPNVDNARAVDAKEPTELTLE